MSYKNKTKVEWLTERESEKTCGQIHKDKDRDRKAGGIGEERQRDGLKLCSKFNS